MRAPQRLEARGAVRRAPLTTLGECPLVVAELLLDQPLVIVVVVVVFSSTIVVVVSISVIIIF